MTEGTCPFCAVAGDRVFYADDLVLGLWDGYPVSPGHALLIPKRHVESWFDATDEERAALMRAVDVARLEIERREQPDGFNIGINVGPAAGQTVFHLHVHVIPRYLGDMADPRGGVRYVIPERARYWEPAGADAAIAQGALPIDDELRHGLGLSEAPHRDGLVTGGDDELLPHLLAHLDRCQNVDLAVAFVKRSGVKLIEERLRDLLDHGGRVRLLTGDYLLSTEPDALVRLLDLADRPDISGQFILRVFEANQVPFHPKAYVFHGGERPQGIAFVGSSNLSAGAMGAAVEWNYRIVSATDEAGFAQISRAFEDLFEHESTVPVTQEWIDAYRTRRDQALQPPITQGDSPNTEPGADDGLPPTPPAAPGDGTGGTTAYPEPPPDEDFKVDVADAEVDAEVPEPHEIQQQALAALAATREQGYRAGLVVLATGLGKTWLSAFDSIRNGYKRVLFVAHREEILDQARRTYRLIAPSARLGLYTGKEKHRGADVLFASIQTLGRRHHLKNFQPDDFDYVVVDEFHHACARTYRQLIDHFEPEFLLGLTATPERTDGGDLLALCQENLVYRCDLGEGIRRGLLSSFKYFGVPDLIDYEQIPWRSRRFDEQALTRSAATEARAQNALEQLQKHGNTRALGFCVSITHADFMAEYFREHGLRAVAVHSGSSSAPRTASLEKLERGELDIVFAIDIFNEGVDLPHVDTLLMLRPTESRIVWLQQFGRGLRVAARKGHLAVIDYIGNHRNFLLKPQALLGLPATDREVSLALRRLERGDFELPPGCEVTYELEAKQILQSLLREPKGEEHVRQHCDAFIEQHGRRPTAVELMHEGFNPRAMRKASGSWFQFLDTEDLLDADERAALSEGREFLEQLEITPMTRSFKMVTLLAMLAREAFPGGIDIQQLAAAFASIAGRTPLLAKDVGGAIESPEQLRQLLEKNPVEAWVGGKGTGGRSYFRYENNRFESTLEIDDRNVVAFQDLTRELVDWRLAEYLERASVSNRGSRVLCSISHNGRHPILFLPSRASVAGLPSGWTTVLVNDQPHEAKFAKVAVNVLREPGAQDNVLGAVLRGWFGDNAGQPGTHHRVTFTETEAGWTMEPLQAEAQAELWHAYPRAEIAGLFGLPYAERFWMQGFISLPGHLFLLVTLDKSKLADEYAYADRFLSESEFEWQSQNRTTQSGKHGQQIRHHADQGLAVHLFVRPRSKAGNKTAPFHYCGDVEFKEWTGEKPITVGWELREPVPARLHEAFGIT